MRTPTLAAAALLAATACSASDEEPTPGQQLDQALEEAAEAASPPPEPDPVKLDFEQSHTWDDGLTASITGVQRDEIVGEVTGEAHPIVRFTVTLDNATGADLDPSMLIVECSSGPDGTVQDSVIGGADDGIDPELPGTITDGSKGTGTWACDFPEDHERLQIELDPQDTEERAPLLYSGQVS